MCQLRGGNYVVGYRSRTQSYVPGSLVNPVFDSLQIIPLTSVEPFGPLILETEFENLAVDVGQDLGVLGKWEQPQQGNAQLQIALILLKTGHPHPLAQISTFRLQFDFDYNPLSASVTLNIMHDLLLAEIKDFYQGFFETLVWNWKSGCLLVRIKSHLGCASSCYFDEGHLGVLLSKPQVNRRGYLPEISLSLYCIPSHSYKEVSSGNFFRTSSYPCARPVVTFLFPELDESYHVLNHEFLLDPAPGQVLPLKKVTLAHSTTVTFTINLTLQSIKNEDNNPLDFRIFVSAMHLRRYLTEHMHALADGSTTSVPWNLWGTEATRWFWWKNPNIYDIEWGLWTYGSKFVLIHNEPDSALHDLSVVDFAPRTATDGLNNSFVFHQTPEYRHRLEGIISDGKVLISAYAKHAFEGQLPLVFADTIGSDVSTTIKTGFAAPVESRLPYRVVTRPRFLPTCEDWSIDGSNIVGLYPAGREDGTILVYRLSYDSDLSSHEALV